MELNTRTKKSGFFKKAKFVCKKAVAKVTRFERKHSIIYILIVSLIVLLLCEMLCRHSFFDAFAFIYKSPYAFFYNYLIILITISMSLFFAKKGFVITITSSAWLILAFVNCIVLCFRTTPFSAIDFSIAINMLGIIDIYLNLFQLILIIVGIISFIFLLIYIWKKTKKEKIDFKNSSLFILIVTLLLAISGIVGRETGLLERKFTNLGNAYKDYGFAYCFSLSIFDTGIQQPEEYANETVDSILKEIDYDKSAGPKNSPNIIVVQLESFFDINRVSNLSTNENPVPNFTYLKENYPHGLITVSSIGGGTANTEFELLTGMNLDHFGPGEYPYKTILKSSTCENPAYTLKEYGYSSHAIHNHTATFYDRYLVYSNLGFDTFTPVEMMYGVEYTTLGWEKDKILTENIINALKSTDNQDFIFTVSVQAHGKYPDEEVESEEALEVVLQNNTADENRAQYKYYAEQLKQTDAFIGELLAFLKDFEEPTAVLFYGDHFPTIYLEEDKLTEGTKYQTDYAIWANYDIECENKNMNCYQLMAHFLGALESNIGTTTKIHQKLNEDEHYQKKLEMIEYDMLYGEKITFKGISPYIRTELQYGISDIYVTELVHNNGQLFVYGNMFNEHTRIKINGKVKDTIFINKNCIAMNIDSLEKCETLQILQMTFDRIELRISAEYQISSFIEPIIPEPEVDYMITE